MALKIYSIDLLMLANPTRLISIALGAQRRIKWLFLLLATLLCVACKPSSEEQALPLEANPTPPPKHTLTITDAEADSLATDLWQTGLKEYIAMLEYAEQLKKEIDSLLDQPDAKSLLSAQKQWQLTFTHYQRMLPFLFIDDITTSVNSGVIKNLSELRFALAAWPLQPGYLDSYGPYLQSGIVNDITVAINANTVRKQNGRTDPEEVTLGLHAMEFLLWGDKEKASADRFQQQDKVPLALEKAGLQKHELPNNRRRKLLELQSQLFISDIKTLIQQWQTNGPLTIAFQQLSPSKKLYSISSSVEASINQLQKLLLYIDEENGNNTGEPSDNFYFDRFDKNRKKAITETVATIRSLYFEGTNQQLGSAIFSADQQEQLKKLFGKIQTQLNEKQGVYNIFVTNSLNEIMSLISTIDEPKE